MVVDIGAQVAGIIISLERISPGSLLTFGSVVDEDTVLAKIDDSLYAAAAKTAKAQLQQAEANKISADANVLQMKAKLLPGEAEWDRAQKLGPLKRCRRVHTTSIRPIMRSLRPTWPWPRLL